jgi:hypothetical protein
VETLSPLDRQALQSIHEISDSCRRGFIEGRITEFPSAFSRVVNYQCVSFYWCVEWYSFSYACTALRLIGAIRGAAGM